MTYLSEFETNISSEVSTDVLLETSEEIRAKKIIEQLLLEKKKLASAKESKPKLESQRLQAIAAIEKSINNLESWLEVQPGWVANKKRKVGAEASSDPNFSRDGNTGKVSQKFLSEGGLPHIFVLWGESNLPMPEVMSVVQCLPPDDSAQKLAASIANYLNDRSCTIGETTLMEQLKLSREEFKQAIALGLEQGLFKQLGSRYGNNNLLPDISDAWNPQNLGETPREKDEMGDPLIFFDTTVEPPQPEDYATIEEFETAWDRWVASQEGEVEEELAHIDAAEVWEQETGSSVQSPSAAEILAPPEPWDSAQRWLSAGVECTYQDDAITWGDKCFKIQPKIKTIYLNPRVLVDFLNESWRDVENFVRHLQKSPHIATEKEIVQHFGCKPSLVKRAIALGIKLQILVKKGDKYELCSDNLICAVESAQDSPTSVCNSDLTSLESQKQTNTVQTSSPNDSQESTTTAMSMDSPTVEDLDSLKGKSISSQPPLIANLSQSKASGLQPTTSEIASPPSLKLSTDINQDSSLLKTSLDSSPAPTNRVVPTEHIFDISSLPFIESGTMRNGFVVVQDTLTVPSLEKGYFWLESPGALSTSGKGRVPGQSRLEAQLKELGILQKGECLNPDWLEAWYALPPGWTDPSESRPATELLEAAALPLAMPLIQDVQPLPLKEFSTSNHCVEQKIKAITLHQPWASLVGISKLFETRGWSTDYRGKIAIHAAKKQKDTDDWCEELSDLLPKGELPFGAVVATADLTDCVLMTKEFINQQSEIERRCGLWEPRRYAWKLENIQILSEPIPARGKQGLWDFELPSAVPEGRKLTYSNALPGATIINRASVVGKITHTQSTYFVVDWETEPGIWYWWERDEKLIASFELLRSGEEEARGQGAGGQGEENTSSLLPPASPESPIVTEAALRVRVREFAIDAKRQDCDTLTKTGAPLCLLPSLDELAALIKAQQQDFEASRREYESAAANHLEKNICLGHLLNAAKSKIKESKSGRWLKWLEENCPQIKERTARLAMRLARNEEKVREKSATVADFTLRKAASLLNKDPGASVTPMKRRSKCRWEQNPDGSRRYEVNICGVKRELHDTYQQAAVEVERIAGESDCTPEQLIVEGLLKLVAEKTGLSEQGAIALAIGFITKENAVAA